MTDPVADRYARTEPLFPDWAAPIYLWVSVAASVIYLGLDLTTASMPGLALTKALGIILLGVYALLKRAPVLAVALLLSAGGDYALAMRPPQLEAGIGFFGAAHLTYIAIFALMVLKGGIKREGLVLAGGLFVYPREGPVLANYGLDTLRFIEPVAPGDTIRARLTCKRKIDQGRTSPDGHPQGVVVWDVQVHNQNDEMVASYDILTLVAKKPG